MNNLQASLEKLKQLLNDLPEDPDVEEVHRLRTQARRVESLLKATEIGPRKRLLHAITPIRKAAGAVRDADVFIACAATLAEEGRDDSLTRLLERLNEMRLKHVRKLLAEVEEQRKELRKRIKRYSAWIEQHEAEGETPVEAHAAAGARQLTKELAHWPPLTPENLHTFRIRVKALRYVLQLDEASNRRLIRALGRVKDAIGEWHDWQELSATAERILGKSGVTLRQRIDAETADAQKHALTTAQTMRKRYLRHTPTSARQAEVAVL